MKNIISDRMKIGSLVLSEKVSLYEDRVKIGRDFEYITLIRLATFIYQRPDTNNIILEMDGMLFQEDPANVYLYNSENVARFKKKIREIYFNKILKDEKKLQETLNKQAVAQLKVSELQASIDLLNERLKVEHSEGRAKQVVGLSKNLRKNQRILDQITQTISNEKRKVQLSKEKMELSLSMVESHMKMPQA